MKFQNILFFLASVALALFAGSFVGNICMNLIGLTPLAAQVVAGLVMAAVFFGGYASDLLPAGALFMAISTFNVKRKTNGKNIGGLAQDHFYAFFDEIDEFPEGLNPDFDDATQLSDLVNLKPDDIFKMKPGKSFYTVPCTLETGQIKSTMVGPVASKAFENSGTLSNPANLDDFTGLIAFGANRPQIWALRELNGTIKIIGTKECPVFIDTYESTNGEKVADGNMQKLGIKAYSSIPSPNYTGALPVEPAPAV